MSSPGDEHDFPPLPKRAESAIHSRVASIQSGNEARVGTPKVPPGFERSLTPKVPPGFENRPVTRPQLGLEELHAHPSRTHDTSAGPSPKKEGVAVPVVSVVPAVPALPRSRKSSLKVEPKQDEVKSLSKVSTAISEKDETADDDADDAKVVPEDRHFEPSQGKVKTEEPSDDSSVAVLKSTNTVLDETVANMTAAGEEIKETEVNAVEVEKVESSEKAAPETKLPKQEASPPPTPAHQKWNDIVLDYQGVSTPDILSRATTPPSKRPEPVKRPTLRTLQITSEMVAQNGSQAPPSTTTERSAAFPTLSQIRQSSRQPSISVTTSRPSTPAVSERLMSQDVSRAGSPPPSVVGSAPGRGKSKAQVRKERKDRAKMGSEMSETGSVAPAATPPTQEAVGPIVARQKKQKKSKTSASPAEPSKTAKLTGLKDESPGPDSRAAEVVTLNRKVSTEKNKSLPKQEPTPPLKSPTPPPPEPELPPQSYTLRDFYTDISELANYDRHTGEEITDANKRQRLQAILASRISPLPKLLAEMVQDGDIAKDHPLFNPPPFTSTGYKLPPDSRKGQAYLDGNNYNSSDVFGMVYLPNKEKRALCQGHAVSVADSGERADDLLRRCLITPGGWILRHLSREEGERVLDLEEKRQQYLEDLEDIGRMDGLSKLEDNDYSNLEGGFDELSRFGERHGVCWVVGENDAAERGFRRARYGRRSISNGLEDDYGLGEAPVDTDDFDEEGDQFDDPDEEGDEEELDGEEMVLEAEVELDEEGYEIDEQDMAFTDMGERVTLPPLPEMMTMPGSWDATFNGPPYPSRSSTHGMYSSLQPMTRSGYNYTSDGLDLPPPPPLPPTSQLPQLGSATRGNTLPPMRHPHTQGNRDSLVNLRAMDIEQLEKRVKEKAREIETARKDAEKAEKMVAKKSKDAGRWRDGILRGAQGSTPLKV